MFARFDQPSECGHRGQIVAEKLTIDWDGVGLR